MFPYNAYKDIDLHGEGRWLNLQLNGHPITVCVDSGSQFNFLTLDTFLESGYRWEDLLDQVLLPPNTWNGRETVPTWATPHVLLKIGTLAVQATFLVCPRVLHNVVGLAFLADIGVHQEWIPRRWWSRHSTVKLWFRHQDRVNRRWGGSHHLSVKIKVDDQHVEALIDTGSPDCKISEDLVKTLKLPIMPSSWKRIVRHVDVEINEVKICLPELYVTATSNTKLTLGQSFLTRQRVLLDYENSALYITTKCTFFSHCVWATNNKFIRASLMPKEYSE